MADCMELLEQIKAEMVAVEEQVNQAVGGKKIAVGRARKALQNVKALIKPLRDALQELKG